MQGTPKRAAGSAASAAHQKAMLGNLVASLIAAESLVTTEAKAKAMRPVAEKCITAARKGGLHQHRRVVALIRDKDMANKLFDEIGPRYAERPGRLHPDPEAGPAPGRQRPDGPHRAGLSPRRGPVPERRPAALAAAGRLRRERVPRLRRPARAATVAGALAEALARTARLRRAAAAGLRRAHRRRGARPGPGGPRRPAAETLRTELDLARSLNRQLAPAVVVRRAEPAPDGFDARRSATARRYRYLVLNAPVPDPLLAPMAWHVADPLDLRAMAAAADALDRRARLPGLLPAGPGDRRPSRSSGGSRGPLERRRPGPEAATRRGPARATTGCCASRSAAGSFCHQMVRSLVGGPGGGGAGRANAADRGGQRLRAGAPGRRRPPAPAHGLCLVSVRLRPGRLTPAVR